MKKIQLIIPFILLCLLASPALCPAQQSGKPKMVLKEYIYDAKEVDEGETIEHSFKVLNEGDGLLDIRKVRPG